MIEIPYTRRSFWAFLPEVEFNPSNCHRDPVSNQPSDLRLPFIQCRECAKHNAMSGWIDAYPKEFQRTGSLNLGHDPILHARAILLPRQTMRGLE